MKLYPLLDFLFKKNDNLLKIKNEKGQNFGEFTCDTKDCELLELLLNLESTTFKRSLGSLYGGTNYDKKEYTANLKNR
jgi:hypothetical protein